MQTTLAVLVIVILAGLTAFLIIKPLLGSAEKAATPILEQTRDNELDKETILSTLNELEFDYKMKKLSDEDFQALSGRYKALAAKLLHEEEKGSAKTSTESAKPAKPAKGDKLERDIEREIEEAVAALRKSKPSK